MKKIKKINYEYIFLGLILVFAFFLRIYKLGKASLWIDEATSAMAAKMILQKGIPLMDSGMFYSRAYVFHYIQAFFLLFSNNDFFLRFPSVIFGLLTVILAYFIAKEYSKSAGIISALFMSVFYLEVFFSRQARFYQLFQLMFFLSLYLLYKSKENKKYLYLSLISLFITIDTQIAGLVLCPFFIIHILMYNKPKWLSIIPLIPLIKEYFTVVNLPSGSATETINYATDYYSFTTNMGYLVILFIPGVIISFLKKKRLTLLMILPSLVLLIGVFSLQTFALRYAYFFAFPIVLYTSVLMAILYEKFGKIILIAVIAMLLFPSNLIFPYTYINTIKPIDYSFNDYSSPVTDYKNLSPELKQDLKDNTLVSYFSSDVEWYIKKPDYVLAFSMNGLGNDQISYNNTKAHVVDRYSGALILEPNTKPNKPYYLTVDSFSTSKLTPEQKDNLAFLTKDCEVKHNTHDLVIYYCGNST